MWVTVTGLESQNGVFTFLSPVSCALEVEVPTSCPCEFWGCFPQVLDIEFGQGLLKDVLFNLSPTSLSSPPAPQPFETFFPDSPVPVTF